MMTVLLYKDTGKYNEDYSASVPCSSSRGLQVTIIITFAWQTKLLELLLLLVFGSQADYFLRNLVQSVINFTLGLEEWKIKEITVLLLFSMM